MILTVTIRRTPAQLCVVTAYRFTVAEGNQKLEQIAWDPAGPLTAREALQEACRLLLDPPRRPQPARWQQPTLW